MACSYCRHPRRIAIDADLMIGTPYRTIVVRYGGSLGALCGHAGHFKSVPYHSSLEIIEQPSLFDDEP
jgi:hypothetical protein